MSPIKSVMATAVRGGRGGEEGDGSTGLPNVCARVPWRGSQLLLPSHDGNFVLSEARAIFASFIANGYRTAANLFLSFLLLLSFLLPSSSEKRFR